MSTTAEVVIKGRNDLTAAVRSAERDLKGLLKTGELVGKFFRGGAIVGAALAFERLAENAQAAAEEIGDKGTALALKQLNKEIDSLKAKGTNLIGKVLGNVYTAVRGDELARVREQIEFLQRMQGRAFVAAGYGRVGTGFFTAEEGAAKLRELITLERELNGVVAPLGSAARTRALSRGGGSEQLVASVLPKGTKSDPMSGLSEITVWQREIFSLGNLQQQALADLSEFSRREVAQDVQAVANETKKMAGEFTEMWRPATDALTEYQEFALQAARNIQSSFADFLFDPFAQGLDGMLKGFVDTLRRMVAEMVASQALKALFTWAGGLGGGVGTFFSGLAGKAAGGPVSGGRPYIVGERGPELFVPGSSGNIIPNGGMGGVSLSYTIDARGADADRIMAVLPAMLKRTKDETVAAVMDLQRRGRLA